MYQLIVESLLGLTLLDGRRLGFALARPTAGIAIRSLPLSTHHYRIDFDPRPHPSCGRVTVDGVEQADREVPLIDDGQNHHVVVTLCDMRQMLHNSFQNGSTRDLAVWDRL